MHFLLLFLHPPKSQHHFFCPANSTKPSISVTLMSAQVGTDFRQLEGWKCWHFKNLHLKTSFATRHESRNVSAYGRKFEFPYFSYLALRTVTTIRIHVHTCFAPGGHCCRFRDMHDPLNLVLSPPSPVFQTNFSAVITTLVSPCGLLGTHLRCINQPCQPLPLSGVQFLSVGSICPIDSVCTYKQTRPADGKRINLTVFCLVSVQTSFSDITDYWARARLSSFLWAVPIWRVLLLRPV